MTTAIHIDGLTKQFGKLTAVDNLMLSVPRGSIFGLLGQKGAGKTTTIRTILNLVRPTAGALEVLGFDTVEDSLEVRRRIGYVPEELTYYPWMTVDEVVGFNAAFYPGWNSDLADKLLDEIDVPGDGKLGSLRRDTQAKVSLVMALGPRPELLIIDDPTAGLDPEVRGEFFETMIENVQLQRSTVLYSTHLLHGMEHVADELAVIHEGRLHLRGSLDTVQQDFKKLRVIYPNTVPEAFPIDFIVRTERSHHQALLTVSKYDSSMHEALTAQGAELVEALDLSLEEIFVETVTGPHVTTASPPC